MMEIYYGDTLSFVVILKQAKSGKEIALRDNEKLWFCANNKDDEQVYLIYQTSIAFEIKNTQDYFVPGEYKCSVGIVADKDQTTPKYKTLKQFSLQVKESERLPWREEREEYW